MTNQINATATTTTAGWILWDRGYQVKVYRTRAGVEKACLRLNLTVSDTHWITEAR